MSSDGSSAHISNEDLTIQIANLIRNGLNSQSQNPKQNLSDNLKINLSLNSQNYALWARMIKVSIGGKSKKLLVHLSTNPPDTTNEEYEQWEQDDLVVFSWLIQNIEPTIASNLTEFPTAAKSLWDALVTTYSSGKDKLQTFDLHVKANEVKQTGMSLENLWIMMQGIWGEIERRDPNPMKCAVDIFAYNKIRSEQKLFQFLNALDHKYDSIKREILRWDPLPSAEEAYASVRKETAHQHILGAGSGDTSSQDVAIGLAVTGSGETEGSGFMSKGQRRSDWLTGPSSRVDKSKLKCGHCGMMRHTKEQCFKLVGFPDWWNDGHKRGKDGKAAAAVGNPEVAGSGSNQPNTTNKGEGFGCIAAAIETDGKGEPGHQDRNDYLA